MDMGFQARIQGRAVYFPLPYNEFAGALVSMVDKACEIRDAFAFLDVEYENIAVIVPSQWSTDGRTIVSLFGFSIVYAEIPKPYIAVKGEWS